MAAFIPNRRDPDANAAALARVREDKEREAGDGFDGTWVAHPDLVPVAMQVFDRALGDAPNQLLRQRPEVQATAADLLNVASAVDGGITEDGLRANIRVAIQYIDSWLNGVGAAAINNLMEDAATAEIARSQVWQWRRHAARLTDGRETNRALLEALRDEELAALRNDGGSARLEEAAAVFDKVALGDEFVEFLTLPAYDLID
jgi:malate synthase